MTGTYMSGGMRRGREKEEYKGDKGQRLAEAIL